MRFPLEVASRVRVAWPAGKPPGVRVIYHDWLEGGLTLEGTLTICAALKEVGAISSAFRPVPSLRECAFQRRRAT